MMNSVALPAGQARVGALADVALLMPAYNGQDDVARTLASFDEDATIYALVVDDGSTPPIVAPEVPGMCVEVLRMPKPRLHVGRAHPISDWHVFPIRDGLSGACAQAYRPRATPERPARPQRSAVPRK